MPSKIIIPSVTATSVMTLFSYIVSCVENRNFNEPLLLKKFIKEEFKADEKLSLPAAWVTHYVIGVTMNVMFNLLWKNFRIKSNAEKFIVSGSVGSIMAVIAWKLIFAKIPQHSKNYYPKFFTQLVIAHFIFAAVALIVQKQQQEKIKHININ